jgi:arylsulfatase
VLLQLVRAHVINDRSRLDHARPVRVSPETPVGVWQGQFTKLRAPMLYNLRADPYARGTDSMYYADWSVHRLFLFVPAQAIVAKYLETFKEFPPRAKAASFTVSDAMEKMTAVAGAAK